LAGPAQASASKHTCLKPISAATQDTVVALEQPEALKIVTSQLYDKLAGGQINNAIADCLLQPGAVNAGLEQAKKQNAAALAVYKADGDVGKAKLYEGAVATALNGAEEDVR
jgi:lysozyme family protein